MNRTADALVGQVLDGRYRVGPRIARGGMATVYEATDLRLDRTVAVKVMHEGLADDDEFVRRFQREARSAARLSHHNVVSVFDTGDDDGTLFLVMEHVPGRTLRDVVRAEAPVSPSRALALVEPVLAALGAAHAAGLVHRDVKPENVLLADDGRVKVADFGLSRAVNAETQHTATGGVLIGTVSYLSPELVVAGAADARADVYAAGVLVYELLTGHKPHQADSPLQVAWKHVHEDIPAPSARVAGIPAYVDALVARATARDPDLRPADARVLLQQVRRVRTALDQGVTRDDDLLADLTPTSRLHGREGYADTGDELPDQILAPAELGRVLDREHDAREDPHGHLLEPAGARTSAAPGGPGGPALLAPQQRTGGPDEPTTWTRRDAWDGAGVPDQGTDRTDQTDDWAGWTEPTGRTGGPADPTGPVSPAAPRRRGRGPLTLVAVLLLALLVGVGGWWFGVARYTATPGVLDLTTAAAKARLADDGLSLRLAGQGWSETVAKGHVLRTDPAPGDRVLKDGTVGVVLSRGPERHDVPVLRGSTLDDAQQSVLDAHLDFGRAVQRYDDSVPRGEVISSDPKAGTPRPRGSAVDVVVSRGPRPIPVPDWTGKDADQATTALRKLGFEVTTTRQHSDTVDQGEVVTQTPDSGTGAKGDTVTLVVSQGPVLVTVPRITGMGLADARAALEAAGFSVRVTHASIYLGLQYVASSSPGSGDRAPKGSTIVVRVV